MKIDFFQNIRALLFILYKIGKKLSNINQICLSGKRYQMSETSITPKIFLPPKKRKNQNFQVIS